MNCYYTPGMRDKYPSTSKFGRRSPADFNGRAQLPPEPTRAMPGSAEKLAVLQARAGMRQALWHPHDAPMDAESRLLGVA